MGTLLRKKEKFNLIPWSGETAPPPFDLIDEITSSDEIDNITKKEYYRTDENQNYTLYKIPRFVLTELSTVLFVDGKRNFPLDPAICAAMLYGANRYHSSEEFLSLLFQYTRFQKACQHSKISREDKQDILDILNNMRLTESDGGSGFQGRKNFRCPKHIHDKINQSSRIFSFSSSTLKIRFIMDALREQDTANVECKNLMTELVDNDLYPKTARTSKRLKNILDGLGVV